MNTTILLPLLIGVNNQFRKLNADDYKADFEFLLRLRLFILPPDKCEHVMFRLWANAVYQKMDRQKISTGIDDFNRIMGNFKYIRLII